MSEGIRADILMGGLFFISKKFLIRTEVEVYCVMSELSNAFGGGGKET